MSVFSCKVKYIEVLIASKKLAFTLYCFNKLDIMPIITLIEHLRELLYTIFAPAPAADRAVCVDFYGKSYPVINA